MAKFVKEQHIKAYKKAVKTIRKDLGAELQIVMPPAKVACPNCGYDINSRSSSGIFDPDTPYPTGPQGKFGLVGPQPFKNTFCPVCANEGSLPEKSIIRETECLREWLTSEQKKDLSTGSRIIADVELRSIPLDEYTYVINAQYFFIDGDKVYLTEAPTPEGLRDIIKFSFYAAKEPLSKKDSVELNGS